MRIAQLFTVMVIAAAVFVGCTNNETNPITPTGPSYAPPTHITALSGNNSVWLVWTPSVDHDSAKFKEYSVTATPVGGGASMTMTAGKNSTGMEYTMLTAGVAYTFTIKSASTDGTFGATSAPIVWAPALQFYNITLYSLSAPAATGRYSGLKIRPEGVGAVSVSLNPDSVDLVFDDRASELDLLSPNLKSGTALPRMTDLADFTAKATSINDLSVADSSIDTMMWMPRVAPLGNDGKGHNPAGQGETFWLRTQDGYYARVFVHADATGLLYATDGTYKYITVDVSFQPNKDIIFSRIRSIMTHSSN